MSRFVWTALALVVFVAPASAQLLRRGHNNCNNNCGTPCVSQCGYSACGSSCGTGCCQQQASCCNQGGVVRAGFLHRGNNCCNSCNSCGQVTTCGGCSGCGTVGTTTPAAPAAKPMPSGAMMTPMQPIIQASATMAPPVAGSKTEGTATTVTPTTTNVAPVMMASNCCCDNTSNNMNSRGGFLRRGMLLRR